MARRRRTSAFDDFITVLARLPWWVCLTIAVVAWLILHPIANSPVDTSRVVSPTDLSGVVASQLLRTFAFVGQFLIPFACVLAAIGSVASRARRKKLLADVQAATQPGKAIDGLNWQQFEQLVGGSPNGSCERRRLFTSINAVMSLLRETVQWQVRDRKLDPLAISSEL